MHALLPKIRGTVESVQRNPITVSGFSYVYICQISLFKLFLTRDNVINSGIGLQFMPTIKCLFSEFLLLSELG